MNGLLTIKLMDVMNAVPALTRGLNGLILFDGDGGDVTTIFTNADQTLKAILDPLRAVATTIASISLIALGIYIMFFAGDKQASAKAKAGIIAIIAALVLIWGDQIIITFAKAFANSANAGQ